MLRVLWEMGEEKKRGGLVDGGEKRPGVADHMGSRIK